MNNEFQKLISDGSEQNNFNRYMRGIKELSLEQHPLMAMGLGAGAAGAIAEPTPFGEMAFLAALTLLVNQARKKKAFENLFSSLHPTVELQGNQVLPEPTQMPQDRNSGLFQNIPVPVPRWQERFTGLPFDRSRSILGSPLGLQDKMKGLFLNKSPEIGIPDLHTVKKEQPTGGGKVTGRGVPNKEHLLPFDEKNIDFPQDIKMEDGKIIVYRAAPEGQELLPFNYLSFKPYTSTNRGPNKKYLIDRKDLSIDSDSGFPIYTPSKLSTPTGEGKVLGLTRDEIRKELSKKGYPKLSTPTEERK